MVHPQQCVEVFVPGIGALKIKTLTLVKGRERNKSCTNHSKIEQFPELLFRLSRHSRHNLWSRNLQHGQVHLLKHTITP